MRTLHVLLFNQDLESEKAGTAGYIILGKGDAKCDRECVLAWQLEKRPIDPQFKLQAAFSETQRLYADGCISP